MPTSLKLKLKTGDSTLADAYYSRFTSLARQTPHSLSVGINVKRAVGEQALADEFAKKLVKNYPRSSQAKTFLASK